MFLRKPSYKKSSVATEEFSAQEHDWDEREQALAEELAEESEDEENPYKLQLEQLNKQLEMLQRQTQAASRYEPALAGRQQDPAPVQKQAQPLTGFGRSGLGAQKPQGQGPRQFAGQQQQHTGAYLQG